MSNENYFDTTEEDVVHDVFLMILSDENDYESVEDVLIGETNFGEHTVEHWKDAHDAEMGEEESWE